MQKIYSRIIGTGSYLPEKICTNDDLAKFVDTNDEWITERTGIKARRFAASYETASSMGTLAATKAIEAANISADQIEMIIVATTTGDRTFPSTACIIQEKLALHNIPAFDVNAACAGFNYAFSIADQFIKTGFVKTVLVIGSEVMSRLMDWTDRGTCILFGDGAGAVILTASDQPGVISTHIHADGRYGELLFTPNAISSENIQVDPPKMRMRGNEVFKIAVAKMGQTVLDTLSANNISKDNIDWLVPHQANKRIVAAVAKKLELPMDKVVLTVEQHGNTSAASVPLALDVAVRDGRIQKGHLLLLESFGGGVTWGSALVKF